MGRKHFQIRFPLKYCWETEIGNHKTEVYNQKGFQRAPPLPNLSVP